MTGHSLLLLHQVGYGGLGHGVQLHLGGLFELEELLEMLLHCLQLLALLDQSLLQGVNQFGLDLILVDGMLVGVMSLGQML